jgi:ADP-ribose pyrophosphatase
MSESCQKKKVSEKMPITVNSRKEIYRGRVFHMVRENIRLENGVCVDTDIIRHPGAAAIIPLKDKENLILLRQYRHAVGGFIWEIPAGTLNPGEEPLECARRELAEETGFSARTWEKLGEIVPVPGYSDERIHIFKAENLSPARQNPDEDEVLDVHEIPLNEVLRMVFQGEIQDSKSLSALFMLMNRQSSV